MHPGSAGGAGVLVKFASPSSWEMGELTEFCRSPRTWNIGASRVWMVCGMSTASSCSNPTFLLPVVDLDSFSGSESPKLRESLLLLGGEWRATGMQGQ